jgi:hypothetical protein
LSSYPNSDPEASTLQTSRLVIPNLALLAALWIGAFSSAATAETPTAGELLAGTAMEDRVEALLAGKKVTVQAHESSPREMAVALACLIPPDREGSLAAFRNHEPVMPADYRDASGPIDPDDPESSLAKLSIGKGAAREAKRYLDAQSGWELSLSTDEIAAFAALDPASGEEVAAVETQLGRMLAQRVRAYRADGLAGIAPVDRGDGELSSTAEDLKNTTRVSTVFQRLLANTHRLLGEFPLNEPPDGQAFYFWTRIRVMNRPVFLLNQRLTGAPDGVPVVIERQFYATQFLGAGQTLTTLIPVQEGTLAFYVNHTFVDRWTGPGFSAAAKRKVGLKLIDDILKEMAEAYGLCEGTSRGSAGAAPHRRAG